MQMMTFAQLKKYGDSKRERAIEQREWKQFIDALDTQPVTYGNGLTTRDTLAEMVDDIARMLREQAAEARNASQHKRGSSSSTRKSRGKEPVYDEAGDGVDLEDDEAFAMSFSSTLGLQGGPSSVTCSKQRKIKPTSLPTPADEWQRAREKMRDHCTEVASRLQPRSRASTAFGDHGVIQPAVLDKLPSPRGETWRQGRPDDTGSEVRVFVGEVGGKVTATLWSNGLSHDGARRSGSFTLYQQLNPDSADFTRLSTSKHPKEYP